MFLEAVETIPSICIIDYKVLESGHTHHKMGFNAFCCEVCEEIISYLQWDKPFTALTIRHGDMKLSVYKCFVVTCWERADLLALVCGV